MPKSVARFDSILFLRYSYILKLRYSVVLVTIPNINKQKASYKIICTIHLILTHKNNTCIHI